MAVRKVSVGKTKGRKVSGSVSGRRRAPQKRRRRVSGTSSDIGQTLMSGLAVAGGIVLGRLGNQMLVKMSPTLTPLMSGLIQIGAGGALVMFTKNPMLDKVGWGLMGQGVAVEAVNFGLVSGIGSMLNPGADRMQYTINGTAPGVYKNSSRIAGSGQAKLMGMNYSGSAITGYKPGTTMAIGRSGGKKCY